jgi:DNA-binding NarL/FixJ family response regulator
MSSFKLRVVIVEDDFIIGEILKNTINSFNGFECQFVYEDPIQFLEKNTKADILLLDIVMPGINGIDFIELILAKFPDLSIIMNTIKDDPDTIFSALKKGASGYIDKQSLNLNFEDILNTVANGGAYMTPLIARKVFDSFQQIKNNFEQLTKREMEITNSILKGLSYKMIASDLGISLDTVRFFVKNIYRKLKINSKGELFRIAKK